MVNDQEVVNTSCLGLVPTRVRIYSDHPACLTASHTPRSVILWPYITYQAGFVFFWACMLGGMTKFFLNMEIERWTLVTGESAITGFCRLSRQWAWVMLLLNIIPWAWPGWATGAGTIISWLIFDPVETLNKDGSIDYAAKYVNYLGVASFFSHLIPNLRATPVVVVNFPLRRGDACPGIYPSTMALNQASE